MNEWMKKLDNFFQDLFLKKAPGLPDKAKEWIVKAVPWLALVFGIMAIPGLLAIFGFGAITTPFWVLRGTRSFGYLIGFAVSAIQVVLQLVAVTYLFKKVQKGWQLLYWATLLSVVSAILHVSGFGLVGAGVSLYLLYQIKSFYK